MYPPQVFQSHRVPLRGTKLVSKVLYTCDLLQKRTYILVTLICSEFIKCSIIIIIIIEYPGFKVEQATFIIDVLGGYSAHLKDNIAKIGDSKNTIEIIIRKLQKVVLSEARDMINKFKFRTSS